MILKNSYFIDEIFIPHAKSSITDDVTAVSQDLISFMGLYEEECLIKCFGYPLYKQFKDNLDDTKPNGLKDDADEKWDWLLNGKEYNMPNGKPTRWRGLRWKNGSEYNKSLIADYVYYNYEKSDDDDRVGVGNVKQEAANAKIVSKTPKVIAAWRRFFEAVVGGCEQPNYVSNSFGNGIDWFGSNPEKPLNVFIREMNDVDKTTYEDFTPFPFKNANQFGF